MSLTIRHALWYAPPRAIWYAHYQDSDGTLLSLGTVVPDPVPTGTTLLALNDQPNLNDVEWDETTLTFIPRDPDVLIDRVYDDLDEDLSLVSAWTALDETQAESMKSRFATMLGSYRYRLVSQPIDLD
jgi:hypothetical protein